MDRFRFGLTILLLGCLSGCSEQSTSADAPVTEWHDMVAVEERIHELTPRLRDLARSLENLRLPDPTVRRFLDLTIETTDIAGVAPASVPLKGWPIRREQLELAAPGPLVAPSDLSLWRPLLDRIAYFEHARFAVDGARYADEGARFETELVLEAKAHLVTGAVAGIRGAVSVGWQRREIRGEERWHIDAWHTRRVELLTAPKALFREVLDAAIDSPTSLARARRSRHEEFVAARIREGDAFRRPHEHFFQAAQDRHPGVSVVDIDGDGFDDIYVMARWGANQLFVNRGDGRFDERAADFGLDVADHSASAIFADFDNDGDPDLLLGRTLGPSLFLENRVAEEGRFVSRSDDGLPGLVSSVSAVDFDSDGLLDVYLSTYAAQMVVVERIEQVRLRRDGHSPEAALLSGHLPPSDARQLFVASQQEDAHLYMSLPGPPNVLLRNAGGGRFEPVAGPHPLRAFRNTYQASWADYDLDGDPDVYLAHDFAPNQLLRNDGDGNFSDVTDATETADVGFGMGAGWGDYDGDGREDLYVSNMYSKAGRRITQRFGEVDERLPKMARGNSLFRNEGDRFEKTSGLEPPALPVEAAGWSWGGQWADVSNDGWLDLFVLSGYYSAPAFVESAADI